MIVALEFCIYAKLISKYKIKASKRGDSIILVMIGIFWFWDDERNVDGWKGLCVGRGGWGFCEGGKEFDLVLY